MKNLFLVIFFVSFFLRQTPVRAADAPWRLPERERVVFQVKWLGIPAGRIVSEITGIVDWQGHKAYRIEVTARTIGICHTLYRVDDRYVSYLDAEHLYSLRHEIHRREGGYKKDAVIDFDQEKHVAHFKSATEDVEKVFSIPPDTQDTVSAAYAARTMPLLTGDHPVFSICNSESIYTVALPVTGNSRRRVHGLGLTDVVHLQPVGHVNGAKFRAGRMSGYVAAAPGHLPALIIIKAPVFTQVTAILVENKIGK